jgi:hypothetical protein
MISPDDASSRSISMSASSCLIQSAAMSAELCASVSSRKHVTVMHVLSPAAIA